VQGHIVTAAALLSCALSPEAPEEIVYIPDGEHAIHPRVNGQPQQITVRIPAGRGAAVAAMLDSALQKRRAENVRPHVAFDHQTGRAAGIPESFRYVRGKGVLLKLAWTGSGQAAIRGRDYSYFSPAFLVDEDGVPSGLPERGEIGSLVNEPAFREIPRIAAAGILPIPSSSPSTMSHPVLAALEIDAAREDSEAAAVERVQALQAEAAKLPALQAALEAAEQDCQALRQELAAHEDADAARRREAAEDLHRRAVACGLFPPAHATRRAELLKAAEDRNTFALDLVRERVEAAERDRSPEHDLRQAIVQASAEPVGAAASGPTAMQRLATALDGAE